MIYTVTPPDTLTGMILGAEGIPDIMVILNSPTGCKFYHGHIADLKRNESVISDPYIRSEPWFFGQTRIPCTGLDDCDFIFGTQEKLEKLLNYIKTTYKGLIILINAPGAALIGDDLVKVIRRSDVSERCIPIEIPGTSLPASGGVDSVIVKILEHLKPHNRLKEEKKINLLGLSILQRYCEGTRRELIRLLRKEGITVLSSPGAGSDSDTIRLSASASVNSIVFPEYAVNTAEWYEKTYSIPFFISPEGSPIGFDATYTWISGLCRIMGTESTFVEYEIQKARKDAASAIARINSISGWPRGARFAIQSESSLALPLTKWLFSYLGMIPVGIDVMDGSYPPYLQEIQKFLQEINHSDCFGTFPGDKPDIIFTDGVTGTMMKDLGICRGFIEVNHPPSGKVEIVPRTILGVSGSLLIIEEILNILK